MSLTELAGTDGLTCLPNRRNLNQQLIPRALYAARASSRDTIKAA
ncbi:MAG: hypothetical protein ACE1Y4_19245 [Lysobacterales bacterium]